MDAKGPWRSEEHEDPNGTHIVIFDMGNLCVAELRDVTSERDRNNARFNELFVFLPSTRDILL